MRGRGKATWYDHVVVDRLWNGERVGRFPTYPEIAEFLRRGYRAGLNISQIAERGGQHKSAVDRWSRHPVVRKLLAGPDRRRVDGSVVQTPDEARTS